MAKILVLGAGVWGTAVASVLADSGNEVHTWSYIEGPVPDLNSGIHRNLDVPYSSKVRFFHSDLNELEGHDFIFIALPSQTIKENLVNINQKKNFIILSKGIDIESGKRISQTLAEIGKENIASLYGPTHAKELLKGAFSFMTCSSENTEFAKEVTSLFNVDYLNIIKDNDIAFTEIMAAMKNIYAIAYGIAEGMNLSINSKSALISISCMEIKKMVNFINSNMKLHLPNGVGDLIATFMHGRNRRFGEMIGRGISKEDALKKMNTVVEGISTIRAVKKLSDKNNLELKLNDLLYSILYEGVDYRNLLTIFKEKIDDRF
mgnify:CR=1 FL=1|tara:strand:- start:1506 stop:2462 length:957 start_codon:yes stop_codon:yes gene_type:complete